MGHSQESLIPGFRVLGPSIFVQDPQRHTSWPPGVFSATSCAQEVTQPAPSSPALIVITSWTGAAPKHVVKYTRSYNDLYPQTPIMVITTKISDLALHTTKHKTAALAPAVDYIRRRHSNRTGKNILLHAFSEGGSNKAVCLAQAYLSATGRRLPVAASVLDSTPGTPRYSSNVAAFRRSLPQNQALRALGLPLGALVLAITWVLFGIFVGYEQNAISKTRRALNDETLWDVVGMARTYVFSQADDLIHWKDIEDHAADVAEKFGTTSMLVRFKDSGHCSHAREHEEYYWNAVRTTWEARDIEACPLP